MVALHTQDTREQKHTLEELFEEGPHVVPIFPTVPLTYNYVRSARGLEVALSRILAEPDRTIAVDTETTGLEPLRDRLLLVQITHERHLPIVIDARTVLPEQLQVVLGPILSDPSWLKVLHNAVFDYGMLLQHTGIEMRGLYCTMIAERLLTNGLYEESASLAETANRYLEYHMDKSVRDTFIGMDYEHNFTPEQLSYAAADTKLLAQIMRLQTPRLHRQGLVEVAKLEFAVIPAIAEAHLYGIKIDPEHWRAHLRYLEGEAARMEGELQGELAPFYERVRVPIEQKRLQRVAFKDYRAAYAGQLKDDLKVGEVGEGHSDYAFLLSHEVTVGELAAPMSGKRAQELSNLWKREHPLPPEPPLMPPLLDLGSNFMKGTLVEMGVPLPKSEAGNLSTKKEILENLAIDYPVLQDILDYRAVQKLIESFGESVLSKLGADGRLHPEFRQLGAQSGRMSASRPPLQQVPGNEEGGRLRQCFIAEEGSLLIDLDYSNIELRLIAEMSNCRNMIDAFDKGKDLHIATACAMFAVNYERMVDFLERLEPDEGAGVVKLTSPVDIAEAKKYKELRKISKIINFAIPYGQGPGGTSRKLKIPFQEARSYQDRFFKANPEVERWLTRTRRTSLLQGYTQSLMGRKRYFRPLDPEPPKGTEEYSLWIGMKKGMERIAGNHPVQSSSADMTKQAIVLIRRALKERGYRARMVLYVHDEILIEAPIEEAEAVRELAIRCMKEAGRLFLKRVPVAVGCKVAGYWSH